jgi:hypothetical protein
LLNPPAPWLNDWLKECVIPPMLNELLNEALAPCGPPEKELLKALLWPGALKAELMALLWPRGPALNAPLAALLCIPSAYALLCA